MSKKKFVDFFFIFVLVSSIILSISGFLYYFDVVSTFSIPNIKYTKQNDKKSYILDNNNNIVQEISLEKNYQVLYEDLPDVFINALISAEDSTFYEHNGYDIKRIFGAILSNLTQNNLQGASTLTQQLMKNMFLSNEKSISRKIKEFILATRFENKYSKEQILEIYVNEISFDGTKQGVAYAAKRFFNKKINDITLPEAAFLAGLVKSPTIYNPFKNLEAANNRKNIVLSLMKRHKYINETQYNLAINKNLDELLCSSASKEETYQYQSYLDVVYEEVKKLTGLDPYNTPMVISTHLDTQVQKVIDKIQMGLDEEITFIDDFQQIGGTIISNDTTSIIGVIGGRNYNGKKLYNRACDMKQQPASTIKPILSYALAYEHLDWSSAHIVEDFPTTYPNTNISINNVDHRYLGEITLEDAIGYSRNTSAVKTLNEVAKKIGMSQIGKYLDELHLLDYESYDIPYSYALGGFLNGVTPLYLAGAYAMLANYGVYKEPTTIKSIKLIENNEIITPTQESKRLLSEETGFLITNTLNKVAKKNYWNIGTGAPKNVSIAAKTGTSNFSYETITNLGYPNNANKDIWYAGYSPDYTTVIWTGFDQFLPNEKTFFANSNDKRVSIARKIFKKIMSLVAKTNLTFRKPQSIVTKNIVKGVYPYRLSTNLIPEDFKIDAYFKRGTEPTTYYEIPSLPLISDIDIYSFTDSLEIHFPNISYENIVDSKKIYTPKMLTGDILYCVDVIQNQSIQTFKSKTPILYIPISSYDNLKLQVYYQYENIKNFHTQKENVVFT